MEWWKVIDPPPDQTNDINRHPEQDLGNDIIQRTDTNTSSSENSDDEYDEVMIFDTAAQNDRDHQSEHREEETDEADWEEIIFHNEQTAQVSNTTHKETTAGYNNDTITGDQNPQTTNTTADGQQFNRAWEALPADLVALNIRHAGELNANKLMVRHTSNPPGALRGLFATEEFKAREIITEYTGRTGLDRTTVEDPKYDSTYAFADNMPDGTTLVIDAWDPITQTVMSLAAYSNDALDPEKYNAKWWRDTKDNMRMYLKATKKIPRGAQIFVAYGAKYWCSDKFSFHVHLKAIKAYTVDIVTSTEDTDGDWTKLQDYRRLLRALGILPNENKTKAKRPRATAGDESGRRVKHKSDFNDYDKTVVIK